MKKRRRGDGQRPVFENGLAPPVCPKPGRRHRDSLPWSVTFATALSSAVEGEADFILDAQLFDQPAEHRVIAAQ
ncbi:MAG: hypothetical protein ACJ8J7_12080, partial [Sulfurifustaceae bacterium]